MKFEVCATHNNLTFPTRVEGQIGAKVADVVHSILRALITSKWPLIIIKTNRAVIKVKES